MRSRAELKRIAKDRLRDAYWPSFAVIAITFFAQTVQFLKTSTSRLPDLGCSLRSNRMDQHRTSLSHGRI